jgi:hypothetical protein
MAQVRGSRILAQDLSQVLGEFPNTQAYASASQAQNRMLALYGVGFGDRGYGQVAPVSSPVRPRTLVRSTDYTNLIQIINTCATHTGLNLTTPSLSQFTVGSLIQAGVTNWTQLVNQLDQVRLQVATNNLNTQITNTLSRTTRWTTQIQLQVRMQFDTEDQVRFFFNSGGSLNCEFQTQSGSNALSADWAQLIQDMGVIRLSARKLTLAGITVEQGFYNLSTSFRTLHTQTSTVYPQNNVQVRARVADRSGVHGGNGRAIEFNMVFTNGLRNSVLDFVDASVTAQIGVTKAISPLQIVSPFIQIQTPLNQGGDPPEFEFRSIITGTVRNYNLLTAAQAAGYTNTMISSQIPLKALVTVDASAVVGSTSTQSPAFFVPSLPVTGSSVELTNRGTIVGKGGQGGAGGAWVAPANINGEAGGTALHLNFLTTLINQGLIGGGGGGGGGSTTTLNDQTYDDPGGSGGGGAGADVGLAGGVGPNSTYFGTNGTLTQGGAGGFPSPNGRSREWALGFPGGDGGDLGQPGVPGEGAYGAGSGGTAGVSVQGTNLLRANSVLNAPQLRGPTTL